MQKLFFSFLILLCAQALNAQFFTRSELSTTVLLPWEITYGPDDHLWLTEKNGIVSRVNPITEIKQVVYTAPDFFNKNPIERSPYCFQPFIGFGTLGLALHPDFQNPDSSYIYYVHSINNGTDTMPDTYFTIKRLKWDALTETVVAADNIVEIEAGYGHLGMRLIAVKQGGNNYLYLSVGDFGISDLSDPDCFPDQSLNPMFYAQDPNTRNGKINRYRMDGSIPSNNPIPGNPFFTRGHRNPQGLMYHDGLELVFDVEHGDDTDDEINLLNKGMNYGWSDVRGYHFDNSFPGEAAFVNNYVPHPMIPNDQLEEAFYSWCTIADTSSSSSDWCTVAPSDGIYYGSNGIPEWENSLLITTLKWGDGLSPEVYQLQLNAAGGIVPSTASDPNPKRFFGEDSFLNGRIRDIAYSTDGKTIFLINNAGTDRHKITVYQYVDPNECLPDLTLQNPISGANTTFQTSDWIQTQDSLINNSLINYHAKNYVTLDNGFQVNTGSEANIYIEGCDP